MRTSTDVYPDLVFCTPYPHLRGSTFPSFFTTYTLDAYMGVTNLEGNMDGCHTSNVAAFAVDLINEAGKILIDEDEPGKGHVNIRVGFHCGSVVSNVIG